jgi:hypothetical protein
MSHFYNKNFRQWLNLEISVLFMSNYRHMFVYPLPSKFFSSPDIFAPTERRLVKYFRTHITQGSPSDVVLGCSKHPSDTHWTAFYVSFFIPYSFLTRIFFFTYKNFWLFGIRTRSDWVESQSFTVTPLVSYKNWVSLRTCSYKSLKSAFVQ